MLLLGLIAKSHQQVATHAQAQVYVGQTVLLPRLADAWLTLVLALVVLKPLELLAQATVPFV